MKLTKNQKSILVGTVLGDGFLQKTGKKNARLRLEHSEKQNEYLLWKVSHMGRVFNGKPSYIKRKHPKSGKTYSYVRHQSNAMPELGRIRDVFYKEGKKVIPKSLSDIISKLNGVLVVAVWYMDDGYLDPKDKNSFIYLGRISKEEAEFAKEAIYAVFGIKPRIYNKKEKGFALYFSVAQTRQIQKKMSKYIIDIFNYKLLPEYRHKTSL